MFMINITSLKYDETRNYFIEEINQNGMVLKTCVIAFGIKKYKLINKKKT